VSDDTVVADIFKPFWRAPGTVEAAPDGAGLGLAIADRVVRTHGGRITAANAREGGLQVTIEVPLSRS
jgi:signal transduction histidine kinase